MSLEAMFGLYIIMFSNHPGEETRAESTTRDPAQNFIGKDHSQKLLQYYGPSSRMDFFYSHKGFRILDPSFIPSI